MNTAVGTRMGAIAIGAGALVFWILVIVRGPGANRVLQALLLTVFAFVLLAKSVRDARRAAS